MKYLLDSDAFSDIVRSHGHVMTRLSLTDSSLIRISTVTVKEIEYGRRRHPVQVTRRSARIDSLLEKIEALPFEIEDAFATGRIRAALARAGTPIGPYDVMIAGTALARGLIVVTANTREFSRVPDLQIENWRLPLNEVRETPAEYRVVRVTSARMSQAA
jgi:tRNA(fMet)-specific endonuclease VapC